MEARSVVFHIVLSDADRAGAGRAVAADDGAGLGPVGSACLCVPGWRHLGGRAELGQPEPAFPAAREACDRGLSADPKKNGPTMGMIEPKAGPG